MQIPPSHHVFLPRSLASSLSLFPPSTVGPDEETLKRGGVETSLTIMDYYQRDVLSHLERDGRRISQYHLLHREASLDGRAGDRLGVSTGAARPSTARRSYS